MQSLLRNYRVSLVKYDLVQFWSSGFNSLLTFLKAFRVNIRDKWVVLALQFLLVPIILNILSVRINTSSLCWQQASHSVKYIGKLIDFHLGRSKQKEIMYTPVIYRHSVWGAEE